MNSLSAEVGKLRSRAELDGARSNAAAALTNTGGKNGTFCVSTFYIKRSFYQDRLGTNIWNALKKRRFLAVTKLSSDLAEAIRVARESATENRAAAAATLASASGGGGGWGGGGGGGGSSFAGASSAADSAARFLSKGMGARPHARQEKKRQDRVRTRFAFVCVCSCQLLPIFYPDKLRTARLTERRFGLRKRRRARSPPRGGGRASRNHYGGRRGRWWRGWCSENGARAPARRCGCGGCAL